MRHRKKGRKLGVNVSHRKAMLKNLAANLIEHKRIKTTDSRAKELRTFIERYTRIIKLGFRDNDRASVSLIELVDFDGATAAQVAEAS